MFHLRSPGTSEFQGKMSRTAYEGSTSTPAEAHLRCHIFRIKKEGSGQDAISVVVVASEIRVLEGSRRRRVVVEGNNGRRCRRVVVVGRAPAIFAKIATRQIIDIVVFIDDEQLALKRQVE